MFFCGAHICYFKMIEMLFHCYYSWNLKNIPNRDTHIYIYIWYLKSLKWFCTATTPEILRTFLIKVWLKMIFYCYYSWSTINTTTLLIEAKITHHNFIKLWLVPDDDAEGICIPLRTEAVILWLVAEGADRHHWNNKKTSNEKKIEKKITKTEDEQEKPLSAMGKKPRGTKSLINLGNKLD